jgi:hypothetical protein
VREGGVRQDALEITPSDGYGRSPLIVALSDGHGGSKHFRSDRGAKFAVESARQCLEELAKHRGEPDLATVDRIAQESLPAAIENSWNEMVDADHEAHPFTETELASLNDGDSHRLAYGATLLASLATPRFLVHLQLGDGDLLVLEDDETIAKPLPDDPLLAGNATTSLCMPGSRQHMRVRLCPLETQVPRLIMLSTDGYSNSFDPHDFPKRLPEYHQLIEGGHAEAVEAQLEGWLSAVSQDGSGDDISLALIYPERAPLSPGQGIDRVAEDLASGAATPGRGLRSLRNVVKPAHLRPLVLWLGIALSAGTAVAAVSLGLLPGPRRFIGGAIGRLWHREAPSSHAPAVPEAASDTQPQPASPAAPAPARSEPEEAPPPAPVLANPQPAGDAATPTAATRGREEPVQQPATPPAPAEPQREPASSTPPSEATPSAPEGGQPAAPQPLPLSRRAPDTAQHGAARRETRIATAARHFESGHRAAGHHIAGASQPAPTEKKTELAAHQAGTEGEEAVA